jgi:hypothetical protein
MVGFDSRSFVDPDFKHAKYSKICVLVNDANLRDRDLLEDYIAQELNSHIGRAIKSLDLMTPTRKWTSSMINDLLLDHNFDALLIVSINGRSSNEIYHPEETTVTQTEVGKDDDGNPIYEDEIQTEDSWTEVIYYASFSAAIYDLKSNRKAWVSSSSSEKNNGDYENISYSYARELVNTLVGDEILSKATFSRK